MPHRFLPHLALLLSMLAWSSSFIALKIALSAYSPMTVMAGRMLAASLVCLPLLKPVLAALRDASVRRFLVLCVICEPCLYFMFEAFALRNTSSAQAGMVIALLPLATAVGAWFFLKERLPGRAWAGFLVAVCGVVWLSLGGIASENAPRPLLGNLLEGGAVLCATGYTLCARHLADRLTPAQITAGMSFGGFVFFLPLSLLPLPLLPVPLAVELPGWMPLAAIVYLGTVVTFVGYGLYNFGICRLSAGRAASYINFIPVGTLIMGVLWLRDSLQPSQYAASGLVLLGVMLSQSGLLGKNGKAVLVQTPDTPNIVDAATPDSARDPARNSTKQDGGAA